MPHVNNIDTTDSFTLTIVGNVLIIFDAVRNHNTVDSIERKTIDAVVSIGIINSIAIAPISQQYFCRFIKAESPMHASNTALVAMVTFQEDIILNLISLFFRDSCIGTSDPPTDLQ